jgi:hypothetical protein
VAGSGGRPNTLYLLSVGGGLMLTSHRIGHYNNLLVNAHDPDLNFNLLNKFDQSMLLHYYYI